MNDIPSHLLPPRSLVKADRSVPALLRAAAKTFEDRNAVYGNNYLNVGPVMQALFPEGVPAGLVTQDHWHLFELMVVKLTRFANSNLTHLDSIHDTTVYSAMVESIITKEKS